LECKQGSQTEQVDELADTFGYPSGSGKDKNIVAENASIYAFFK